MVYEFRLPDIGEGVAEGEVVKWFVREGEDVKEDAPLVSVLTDKANVEIPSPRGGKVLKLHAKEGEKVKVGALLVTFEGEGGAAAPPAHAAPSPVSGGASAPTIATPVAAPAEAGRALATPFVRRRAAELGIDLAQVRGSGPGGRVTEADLESFRTGAPSAAGAPPAAPPGSPAAEPPPAAPEMSEAMPPAAIVPGEGAERVPIRGVRRVIAEHMSESVHRAAHFTYVDEVDVTELVRLRDRFAKHIERHGTKLSYLPFVIKAVVAALRQFPWMNATIDDTRQELIVHREYNIGVAAAAPEGLLVPVIHGADRKSLTKLAHEIQELAEKARAGKLSRAEMTGGTFTITSLGALGGLLATPILNYPEVAILGVHQIKKRPVYREDGTIGPAQIMNLSVSLDHRILDGIVGAQFLAVVKGYLEEPHQLFAELA